MQMTHVTSCNGPTIRPEEMNSEKEKNKKKRKKKKQINNNTKLEETDA